MLYSRLLTVNETAGVLPETKSSNTGDLCNTLMSLCDSGSPKNACQIHKSYDATASSTMEGFLWWPTYIPCHATGYFSQCQCMQSKLPIMPGNPRSSALQEVEQDHPDLDVS